MILVIAMVLSLLPAVSFAAGGSATWKAVELGDIQPGNKVAITMTKDATTYVLPTVGEGGSKQPLGITATVSGEKLTTQGDASAFGWNIVADEGGFRIVNAEGKYLYVTATNNGVRIGEPSDMNWALWNVLEGYLTAADSKGATRYVGVYEGATPDWRCYTSISSNIAGETLGFWVLDGENTDPTETTQPSTSEPTETTEPSTSEPTEPSTTEPTETTPPEDEGPKYVIAALVGDTYYAMANTFGAKISGTEIPVENGVVAGKDAGPYAVTLTKVDGGYTISVGDAYLKYNSGTNLGSATEPYVWSVSAGTNGTYRLGASSDAKRGLVFRAGTYNQFGGYAVSNAEAGSTEYFDVEILSVDGKVEDFGGNGGGDDSGSTVSKAYKPKASPEAGAVVKGTEVTLTCSTKNSKVVYHFGDGNWVEFSTPIVIDRNLTITAKSQAEGKADSDEVTFAYTVYEVGADEAILVTNMSQLASGDQIIIVAKDFTASLGIDQRAKNRGVGNVIKTGNTCRYDDATQVLTLESGVTEGTYALYTGQGYLYAPSDDGNFIRTQEDKSDIGSFFITIAEDGTATISADTTKVANTIFYNNSNKIFSCYNPAGSQKVVCIYKLANQERPGLPENGDTVVLYNLAARGAVSVADSGSLKTVGASLSKGLADCANGAFLFKVEKNGETYRFFNETFGYLTAKGNNLSYVVTAGAEADWFVEAFNGGYKLLSSDSKVLLGQTGFVKLGNQVNDKDTATYHFYPCNSEAVMDGIVNLPEISFGNPSPAYAGQDYVLNFSVDAVFGAKELEVTVAGTKLEIGQSYGRYTVTVPADMITGTTLEVIAKGVDNKGIAMEASIAIEVKDEPMISDMKPVSNSQTKDNKRPEISAKVANVGANPTITLTVNDQEVTTTYANGLVSYKPETDLADGRTVVILTVTREDGKYVTKKWRFTVGEAKYTMLFGQLHAHTGEYSDGAGTLAGALEYIAGLPAEANVDFVAFTDHSNYFDTDTNPNPEDSLFDLSLASPESAALWTTYKNTLAQFNNEHKNELVLIPGFEMTWSGGPGHMNTFVTEGIVSRNNTTLNNKSADAGMRAYYELISREEGEDSITQLNHPGTSFGNFTDFAYWTPEADAHVYLVEVGNGEGPVRGGGYFPSYEQYTLALDKGWHVAPTNNQDNHKGKWGNANEARDVILAEEFTEDALYDAIRNYRVYATEDRNLEIAYTVNDLPMGTIIENVPETLNFSITLKDPDAEDTITSVELIVNSGKVAYTWDNAEELASGVLTAELNPDYSYYYVRVIQGDKDIAVTAPVWVGDNLRLGVREARIDAPFAVVGEEVTIETDFYNEERADAVIKSIVYTIDGSEVICVDEQIRMLSAGNELTVSFVYVPEIAKLTTITITAVVEYDGKEYTYTASVKLDVIKSEEIGYMAIDASHMNEYVSGHYSQMMTSFTTLAQEANIRVTVTKNSKDLIAACKDEKMTAIVINVPTRRVAGGKVYTQEELEALTEFNARGGILIISNQGDENDAEPHMAATMNALLAGLGSSLRFMDDSIKDTTNGKTYDGIYASAYGKDPLTEGLTQSVYYYKGSSVYAVDENGQILATLPETVSGLLYANYGTNSHDMDGDNMGASAVKYAYTTASGTTQSRYLLMAAERVEGKGLIFVSGVPFMNDYNVTFPAQYGNNDLAENLLNTVNPMIITDIAEVRAQTEVGYKYNIQGVVTSNASGYDKDTAFFDCIYVQDETAGINCFPVSGTFKVGDVVRVQGLTEFYIGEPELQVQTIEKIGETEAPAPVEITARQLNDRSVEGQLITLKGYVTNFTYANGLVESIYIKDAQGVVARAFIDGYITAEKEIANLSVGGYISVTGLASYDNTYAIAHCNYARIRVRDRADIVAEAHSHNFSNGLCTECGAEDPHNTVIPFSDVASAIWYANAVSYDYVHGLMNGMNATTFGPEQTLNRAMIITILHRIAGSPKAEGEPAFEDVPANAYYAEAVAWGFENGIVKGMTDTLFNPDAPVTREQMVTFLYRFAVYMGCEVEIAAATDLSSYVDASAIGSYAKDPFAWAVGKGLVNGMGHNNLAPQGTATRAQVAKVIMMYHSMLMGTRE